MRAVSILFRGFDWWLVISALLLSGMGLVTMYSYQGDNVFFERQFLWIVLSVIIMSLAIIPDYRFLRLGHTTFVLYLVMLVMLVLLLLVGDTVLGAQRRFDMGIFSFQPSEPAKLIIIALMAKYFSKRHELIGDVKHIIVSGLYASIFFILIFLQPDFGSAVIIGLIWFGMVLVSGIRLKHIVMVLLVAGMTFGGMWQFAFQDYQKQRILTFLDPLSDIQGSGYNAYQSLVAVGSGQLFGKGVGYGTQSKLKFLPEYETDFIFAAFAEEWGLLGVIFLFTLFSVLIWRLLYRATRVANNFEKLFITGVVVFFVSHFFIHIGMNIGLLPVTGTTIPFLSYGGTHLMTEFLALGMVMSMTREIRRKYVMEVSEVMDTK